MKDKMSCLKSVQVNEIIFNQILKDYEFKVRVTDDLYPYLRGYYEDRDLIYYNGSDEFICLEYIVDGYTNLFPCCTVWKQVRVRRTMNMSSCAEVSITGPKAKAYIHKLLKKYYTLEEIDQRLRMFESPKDPDLIQMHYYCAAYSDRVTKIENTCKFDINGAHLDALCEIFPKAKDDFVKMYQKRKTNKVLKQYPNLYVGMLAMKTKEMRKKGIPGEYELTYNWIVQRTTKMLQSAMTKVGGTPVYINTDGFIVQNPDRMLATSTSLGDFKLEYSGTTWVYGGRNYTLFQTGEDDTKELKGSCMEEARKDIDLSKGLVVSYDIKQELHYRHPINIKKVEVPVDGN